MTGTNGLGLAPAELPRAERRAGVPQRSEGRGGGRRIRAAVPGAAATVRLGLSSLASVRQFAGAPEVALAVLINNAGIMMTRSADRRRFELQFRTNHLGHFA